MGENSPGLTVLTSPIFEKLDKILICLEWEEYYPLSFLQALERELSGHTSLILDIRSHNVAQPIFRFENSWMLREGF